MSERRLTLADLVPGRTYRSPSGRICRLMSQQVQRDMPLLIFSYLNKRGTRPIRDGFAVSTDNAATIAALQEIAP